MKIKLVVLDLDGVIWDHLNASELQLPLKKINANTLEDVKGEKISINPGIRYLLEKLKEKGIIISVASWNDPKPVFEALKLFGITEYFKHPQIMDQPNKGEMIKSILEKLREENITVKPEETLYIDDRLVHLEEVKKIVPGVHFLQIWVDVKDMDEILEFIEKH